VRITFTDDCPGRLSRGPAKSILFVNPGDAYEVPEVMGVGEAQNFEHWLEVGWAKEEVKKKKVRKGAEGTGPVAKSEVDAPEGTTGE